MSPAHYEWLAGHAPRKGTEGITLEVPSPSGSLRLKVTAQGTRLVLQGDGLFVVVAHPSPEGRAEHFGCELQYQGRILSTGVTGLDVVRSVRHALWHAIFPGTPAEIVHAHTLVGRMDLAVDVLHEGPRAEDAVDRFYEEESPTAVYSRFCTHTSSRRASQLLQILGTKEMGRTFRCGSDPLYRIYEREKHTEDGHWAVLKDTYERLGYDGSSPVLRCEAQVRRSGWMRDQRCSCESCVADAGRAGKAITTWTEDEAMRHVPGIAKELFERFRHTTPEPHVPKKLCPSSPLWEVVLEGTSLLTREDDASVVVQLRCVQRKLMRENRQKAIDKAAIELAAIGLEEGDQPATVSDVLMASKDRLAASLETEEGRQEVIRIASRARYKAGLPPDPKLTEEILNGWQSDYALRRRKSLVRRGRFDGTKAARYAPGDATGVRVLVPATEVRRPLKVASA